LAINQRRANFRLRWKVSRVVRGGRLSAGDVGGVKSVVFSNSLPEYCETGLNVPSRRPGSVEVSFLVRMGVSLVQGGRCWESSLARGAYNAVDAFGEEVCFSSHLLALGGTRLLIAKGRKGMMKKLVLRYVTKYG